jgi:hypothetical protein
LNSPTIAAVVDRERQCCRFLQFSITLDPNLGPIWLEVGGPEGTKAILALLVDNKP